ncbi:MAG TPA: hypothetical protein VHL57_04550 [Flavobacteriales bacterium]|jgi:hypothetical protein|nr:hypothetical protein [Flavobacteriales bacterium]
MLQRILPLCLAIGLLPASASAQVGLNKLKDKAKSAAEKKANDAVNGTSDGINRTNDPGSVGGYEPPAEEDPNVALEKQMAEYQCEPSTGVFHSAHVGQVVFAGAKITREAPESAGMKSSFGVGDNIYARVYLAGCLAHYKTCEQGTCFVNVTTAGASFFVTYTVDGKGTNDDGSGATLYAMDLPSNDKNQYHSTFNFPIVGTEESGGTNDDFVAAVNKLAPGEHTIHFDVWAGMPYIRKSEAAIATGEIKLVKKAGGAAAKLGRTFKNLEAGMTDAALEVKMLAAAKRRAKAEGWKETVSKVKISDTGWSTVRKESTGIITGRSMSAWVYATWPDGHCTYQDFGFFEEYDGTNYTGNVVMSRVGAQTTCDCE